MSESAIDDLRIRVERIEAALRTAFREIAHTTGPCDLRLEVRDCLRRHGRPARAVEIMRWLLDERSIRASITDVRRALEDDEATVSEPLGGAGESRGWWRLVEANP